MKLRRGIIGRPLVGAVVAAMGGALLAVPILAQTAQAAPPPSYTVQTNVSQPADTRLTAVDPYANATSSADGLKPARPFWYSADKEGLTILRISDNSVVKRIPYPTTYDLALPQGDDFQSATAPTSGWEPVGITVSYPTEEQLASNSESPATNVFLVMKHSGYEWQSATNPPALQDPGQRDTIVTAASPDTDSSVLLQLDVTDPTFSPDVYPNGPTWAGGLLGHDAGQPAFDPSVGNVYVPNMPSSSLPTSPSDLSSFISVMMPIALAENAAAEPPSGAPGDPPVVMCGPEHPDEGLLAGTPYVWPCTAEGGEGTLHWDFQGLPDWLKAHQDKLTHELDGILYGTPPTNGTWTFTAKVTDLGDDGVLGTPDDIVSEPTPITLNVTPTGVASEAEAGWEAGIPGGQAVPGSGTCEATPTSSPGSMVPNWVDVVSMPSGCAVMGTAPISGEHYEFTLPNFTFPYPYDREPVIFSGSVAGTYGFDPLPQGVGLSGLAWHQVEKIHDPSTEADILNVEFIGVEPATGQLYQVLPPQGSIEVNEGTGPPETSVEADAVTPITGPSLLNSLYTARPDIAAAVSGGTDLKVHFGDLAVEADRHIYVTASEITGASGIIPIGGTTSIDSGAVLAVQGGAVSTIDTPGVQAKFLGLDANLAPAIPNVEPGQQDNGVLWVSGTTSAKAAAVDTHAKQVAQTLDVPAANSLGGVSVDYVTRSAYVATTALQSVAIIGTGSPEAQRAPSIWTGSTETFYVGQFASFPIATTGNPTPTPSVEGALPAGVSFVDKGNGMAAIEGTPAEGTGNDYAVTLKATNGIAPDASFAVVLTVVSAPTITSADNTTFTVGCPGSFPLTINGAASLLYVTLSADAPSWLTITQGEDIGTLTTLDGTPPGGSAPSYSFDITASTGVAPDAVQHFTLTVTDQGSCTLAPTVSTQPANQTVTAGQTATFTAAATGNPIPTIQWQLSTDGGTSWSPISGATGNSYTTSATTGTMNGYRYRAAFTNTAATVYSNSATLTVTAPAGTAPSVTTQPVSQTVNAGLTATFTAAANGDPAPTVQWQRSTNGTTWSDITGETGTSYTTPATTSSMNGYAFRAVFSNSVGTAYTNAAVLTVNTAPVVTGQPANQTVTEGQTATFTATASGNPTPTVQWQQSANGTAWSNISGANSTSYTTPATTTAMNGTQYRAVFTNSVGTANSNGATLTVNPAPVGPAVSTQPANVTVTVGQAATFESTATGNPAPSVKWQLLTTVSGATWTDIPGATSTVYKTAATTLEMNGYRYRAVFTNSVGSVTSNNATLAVTAQTLQLDVVTTTLAAGTVGQAYSFTVLAQGGTAPYSWALARRSNLPSGLRLASAGVISGTPRQAGTYAFVVVVTDAAGHTAQGTLTLTIARR